MSILDRYRKTKNGRTPIKGRHGSNLDWKFNQVLAELEANTVSDVISKSDIGTTTDQLAAATTLITNLTATVATLTADVAALKAIHGIR